MRRRKKCRCCQQWYPPHPQTYRQQKTCERPACRAQRRRQAWHAWSLKNPLSPASRHQKVAHWRAPHGAASMRRYRQTHPAYVRRNRALQHRRDTRRRLLVKPTVWNSLHREKLTRIRTLRSLVTPNECTVVLAQQIDGLCRYLAWAVPLVTPNAMAPPCPHAA